MNYIFLSLLNICGLFLTLINQRNFSNPCLYSEIVRANISIYFIQLAGIFIANFVCLNYSYFKSKIQNKKIEFITSKSENIFKILIIISVFLTEILSFFKENNNKTKKDLIN